ncbi:MAG TPA: glycosyltransferase family 4 protein [Steroidobacteraceae bacterium]|nr:glycosyltransferase family 4 protein [Steroidobacteraceae bacterium]
MHKPGLFPPLRVYWLTEAFYPPIVGGQEMFAANLVHALADRGATVNVITRQTNPAAPAAERIGAVGVRRISPAGILKGKGWAAAFPLISYLMRLTWLLLKGLRYYDVVIVSGVKIMPLIVVPLCLLTGKKCILRVESFFELQETVSTESLQSMDRLSGHLVVAIIDRIRRWVIARGSAVIAISSEIQTGLRLRGIPDDRIHRIPNAVDLRKFRPLPAVDKAALRASLGLPADRTVVIFSGRLSRAKGLQMLVEAWPRLLKQHPDLYLLIVGSGKLSFDNCEDAVKGFVREHALSDDVMFYGESDRVHELLQASDLFVFPTEYEGFSLALVEALGSALPVVVTAVGAAPDLIEQGLNGFLFPPKDPEALVSALESALQQRSRWSEIAAAARASVLVFDLATVADRYLKLSLALTSTASGEPREPVEPA